MDTDNFQKRAFTSQLAKKLNVTDAQARVMISNFFEVTCMELQQLSKVHINGWINIHIRERRERSIRDFRSGEIVKIPARKEVVLKPGRKFKAWLATTDFEQIPE